MKYFNLYAYGKWIATVRYNESEYSMPRVGDILKYQNISYKITKIEYSLSHYGKCEALINHCCVYVE